jgi:Leucine-rich repeat (LRR) protein
MQKKDFTQYKTKEDFLKDFPIRDGALHLCYKQINDDDLKHILELIGEEPSLEVLSLDSNELTTLPVGAFEGLSSLKRLYLSSNQLTTLPKSLKSILPNCNIIKDDKCIFVDDVASNQETPVIAKSNVIDVLNAKVQDIDKEIAKLQFYKKNIQKTIKIMQNN